MAERERIALSCTKCGARNYRTTKAKKIGVDQKRLSLKKFCSTCKEHTEHKETK